MTFPRPKTSRSNSSSKRLPPLPTGGLGLDFSGLSKEEEEIRLDLASLRSSKPSPSHFIPLRGSPFSSHSLPLSSPSIISSSPSTPTAGGSGSYPFPYANGNANTSTFTVANRSTSTLMPPSPITIAASMDGDASSTPKSSSSRRKVAFGKSSISAESFRSETQSGSGLRRKGSSSQLLMGIGKGLNRVGSVMRRNTAEGTESSPANHKRERLVGTGRGGRRRKTQDDGWEKIDKTEAVDEGDAGIGRPFNVGHDLHVSPDLGDLPPAWLESLKAQGLTESDLLLITAARRKQHAAQRIPLNGSGGKAPLSAPAPATGFTDTHFRDEPSPAASLSLSRSNSTSNSNNLLRKFSFERECVEIPATRDVFDSAPIRSSSKHASMARGKKTDSYPVSPGCSEEDSVPAKREQLKSSVASSSATARGTPVKAAMSVSAAGRDESTPRKTKRFSDQLRGFRESTFGLDEANDDWGQSILSAAGAGAWEGSSSSSKLETVRERESLQQQRIPLPRDEPSAVSVSAAEPRRTQMRTRTPPSLELKYQGEGEFEASTSRSPPPPPPARPRHKESHHSISTTLNGEAEAENEHDQPTRDVHLRERSHAADECASASTPVAGPRQSSESFGVHYTVSTSSASVGSELITPCSSAEQDALALGPVEVYGASDEDEDGEGSGSGSGSGYLARAELDGKLDERERGQLQLHDSFGNIALPHIPVPRRYHSNPHISLPASAGPSTLPSRCVTPDGDADADDSRDYGSRIQVDMNKLSPSRSVSESEAGLRAQPSYSTFDSAPYRLDEDPLDGLDKATPDERASIALSLLSSRTSTSMHSLHELSQATVRFAYKLPPGTGTGTGVGLGPGGGGRGSDARSRTSTYSNTSASASASSSGGGRGQELSLNLVDEGSECSVYSGTNSEETGEEARDAMDALGEAARRLRGV